MQVGTRHFDTYNVVCARNESELSIAANYLSLEQIGAFNNFGGIFFPFYGNIASINDTPRAVDTKNGRVVLP